MKEESRLRAIRVLRSRLEDLEIDLQWAEHTPAENYTPVQGAHIPQDKLGYRAWVISSIEEQILFAKRRLLRLSKGELVKLSKAGREPGEEG